MDMELAAMNMLPNGGGTWSSAVMASSSATLHYVIPLSLYLSSVCLCFFSTYSHAFSDNATHSS